MKFPKRGKALSQVERFRFDHSRPVLPTEKMARKCDSHAKDVRPPHTNGFAFEIQGE
jgi:hypothetical protein